MLAFSLSFFTFIKRLFSFSLLSAIRVVSFANLRLLIFLPAILIPAWASSSLAFPVMYSAYKLNIQGNNRQPWHTPMSILKQYFVPCLVLTVFSWPAYWFLRRQVRRSGNPISPRIFHILLQSTQSKNPPAMQETLVQFLGWKISWRNDRLPTPLFLGFPCSSAGKESACNMGDLGSISGLGRSPGEGKGYPLQFSRLENSMDCIVPRVTKSLTQLNDFHFYF